MADAPKTVGFTSIGGLWTWGQQTVESMRAGVYGCFKKAVFLQVLSSTLAPSDAFLVIRYLK